MNDLLLLSFPLLKKSQTSLSVFIVLRFQLMMSNIDLAQILKFTRLQLT